MTSSTPQSTPATDEPWAARFRAARVSLPDWAEDHPDRCLYLSNATGVFELYAWDRSTDARRQVTDRPNGTLSGTVEPGGEHVWWFADTDGDEWGVWKRQPFAGGADVPATDLQPSYPAGLAIGRTIAVIGRSTDDGTDIHVADLPAGTTREVYRSTNDAHVGALTRDERLVCVAHSEHGDSRHMALRILALGDGDAGGRVVADKWDGEGKGLEAVGFSPAEGDQRLLVVHERRGRPELLIWDLSTGATEPERELTLDLPGEVAGSWYADGSAVLVNHDHAARTELYRYDLATGVLSGLDTPRGVTGAATARPDGTVEFAWSSSAEPPVIRSDRGSVVLTAPGEAPPRAHPVDDSWVDSPGSPGGKVHALVVRPPEGKAPYPTVFVIHGGPEALDDDSFRPRRAAWVDAGYCVVHVNYRGSTGYGSTWRDALTGRPGRTELEDVAAVHDWAVDSGLVDPARVVLAGDSWGGYLTLLGLGTQPERWTAGVAGVPVADYVAAYADEMEPLRAYDRALFGGSPDDLPDLYRRSSPITYVDDVRAPVLVMAGANDPRCPIRQIDNYLQRLTGRGAPHEVYRYDAGHGSLVVEEQIRQMAVALDFVRRHVPPDA